MFFLFLLLLLVVALGRGDDTEFDYEYEGAHSMRFGGKIYQWLHRKDLGEESLYQSPIALRTNIDPEKLEDELHFVNYKENIFGKLLNNGHSVQFTATDSAKKKSNWPRIIFKAKEKKPEDTQTNDNQAKGRKSKSRKAKSKKANDNESKGEEFKRRKAESERTKPVKKPKKEEPMLRYSSYRFEQYHIHWGGQDRDGKDKGGSEHRLCETKALCTHYAAELHLVHVAEIEKDPTFVVVAILLDINDDATHTPLAEDFKVLDHIVTYGTDKELKGSLTTPKYMENKGLVCPQVVDWIVLTQPAYITTKQLEKLRKVQNKKGKPLLRNWRPLQELNKRHPKRFVHPLTELYKKCEPKQGILDTLLRWFCIVQ
ncbi:eukaryotic-type carbonic anhydrase domain-containing protein [Ditylenchus destructor]|nr:eukaryotic-type carbonic anhydrase domain-containing protein [Ditylenchus destructor]